jgi:hypothetical protein
LFLSELYHIYDIRSSVWSRVIAYVWSKVIAYVWSRV